MPVLDWSATAAWIALIVAILSPVLTTIFTIWHQQKMKEKELLYEQCLKSIESFMAAAGEASQNPSKETFIKYASALGAATLYLPPSIVEIALKYEPNAKNLGEGLDFKGLASKISKLDLTSYRKFRKMIKGKSKTQ